MQATLIELNAAGWTTFFCPAHGATMHTKKGTPQEPCTGRLDWLRKYEAEKSPRGFGNPLTKEPNSQKAREYAICRTCPSRPVLTKNLTKQKGRPPSGRRCSCGDKHYARGMCKLCYMMDYYSKGRGK